MTETERQLAYIDRELQKERDPLDLRLLEARKKDILKKLHKPPR